MEEFSQIQRLLLIVQQLSLGRSLTTQDLVDRFDSTVSKRTLQRDLIILSEAGIPICSEKGRGNENIWYLDSRFKNFIPIPIEINEYLAAHTLKENLKVFRNTVLEKDVKSLLTKIEQIIPNDVFLDSRRGIAESFFEQYSAGLFDYSPHNEKIEILINGILNKKICRVTYSRPTSNSVKSYEVEPVKIVNYNGALYAIAFIQKHHAYIMLAIQRIQSLELEDKPQGQNHTFDVDEFWQGKFGLFPGEQTEVKLMFTNAIRHHIEGRQWHVSQIFEEQPDGSLILSLKVGLSPELMTWILGWGEEVRVLKPLNLKKQIIDHLNNTLNLYL